MKIEVIAQVPINAQKREPSRVDVAHRRAPDKLVGIEIPSVRVNRKRVGTNPPPELRRIIPRSEINEPHFRVVPMPGVSHVFAEGMPPRRPVVALDGAGRLIRDPLDQLASVVVDDERRRLRRAGKGHVGVDRPRRAVGSVGAHIG